MASVTFKRGTKAEIEATAKQDGQILMETDQNKKNKMYIDLPDGRRVLIGNSGEAIDTSYDNTTSGLDATNVQNAIDKIENNVGDISGITDSLTATSSNIALSAAGGNNLQGQIDTLNSSLLDIGKTCCFRQSNQSKVSNGYCPVNVQEYNDDTNLYRADASGVLITKPGTYLVVAHFHVLFAMNDTLTLKIANSIKEIINASYNDTNHNADKQIQITLSTIVRVSSGQERVLLNIISNNGASYIYDLTLTNINRIAITKIK